MKGRDRSAIGCGNTKTNRFGRFDLLLNMYFQTDLNAVVIEHLEKLKQGKKVERRQVEKTLEKLLEATRIVKKIIEEHQSNEHKITEIRRLLEEVIAIKTFNVSRSSLQSKAICCVLCIRIFDILTGINWISKAIHTIQ